MCGGTEAGSYLRLIDSGITQLKAQGPCRTCNESKEEEEDTWGSKHDSAEGSEVMHELHSVSRIACACPSL